LILVSIMVSSLDVAILPPALSSREKAIAALQHVGPCFRLPWAPSFTKVVFMILDPAKMNNPDAADKLKEACEIAGLVAKGSAQDNGRMPVYNPKRPEDAFIAIANKALGASPEGIAVLLNSSNPDSRYIEIQGDANLRMLADLGVKFEGYEHLLSVEKRPNLEADSWEMAIYEEPTHDDYISYPLQTGNRRF